MPSGRMFPRLPPGWRCRDTNGSSSACLRRGAESRRRRQFAIARTNDRFMRSGYRSRPGSVRAFGVVLMTNESDPNLRRRKLRYRAAHRGTREMDFVLGRFADAEADTL